LAKVTVGELARGQASTRRGGGGTISGKGFEKSGSNRPPSASKNTLGAGRKKCCVCLGGQKQGGRGGRHKEKDQMKGASLSYFMCSKDRKK